MGSEEKYMRKKRTLTIELCDEDMERLCKKAGSVSMTAGELLENFIADLICGERTNGSDERECADRWFDRCGFAILKDKTFLVWLIGTDMLDDVAWIWEEIQYINRMGIKDQDDQEELDEYWDELKTWFNEYKDAGGEYDELESEMEKVMAWKQEYDRLMEGEGDEEAGPEPNEH